MINIPDQQTRFLAVVQINVIDVGEDRG